MPASFCGVPALHLRLDDLHELGVGLAQVHHRLDVAAQPDGLRTKHLVAVALHVEDRASSLDGRQQGVPPGAQLDELCFGAGLGVLGGAKLWLRDGIGLLPLAWCHPQAWLWLAQSWSSFFLRKKTLTPGAGRFGLDEGGRK